MDIKLIQKSEYHTDPSILCVYVSVQPAGVAYLPPTAAAAASYANDPWSSALAAVPRLTTLRLPHTTGSPPYMMVPNVTGSPSSRLMAGGAQNIIELGMFAIQHGTSVPILVQSTDTLVFNAPANAEPQPVGASVDQIERNTLTQQYKKEDDVPEGMDGWSNPVKSQLHSGRKHFLDYPF
jgi:hypothetical protein